MEKLMSRIFDRKVKFPEPRVAWLIVALSLLVGCGAQRSPPSAKMPSAARLAITGVTIVDTQDGTLAPDMNVIMDQGKIVSIGPVGAGPLEPSTTKIDAQGKFVIPGFLDMHAHVLGRKDPTEMLSLMLANGITGWRQMAATPELLQARREGTLPMSGVQPELLAMPDEILSPLNSGTPARAVATVQKQKRDGADFVKVILVSSPSFFAAQAEAKRLGLPFVGHLPPGVDIIAASKGGMKSIEHLGAGTNLMIPCSSDAAALREEVIKTRSLQGFGPKLLFLVPFKGALMTWAMPKIVTNTTVLIGAPEMAAMRRMIDTYSEEKCRQLAAQFVADGTWQEPTLIREKSSQLADSPEFLKDPHLRYMPPEDLKNWRETEEKYARKFSTADKQTFRDYYELHLKLVKLFDESGVKMLIGDDVGGAGWVVPGFALHREFDEFEKPGWRHCMSCKM
jgi:hypothetical protein